MGSEPRANSWVITDQITPFGGPALAVGQADHDHGYMVPDMVPEPDMSVRLAHHVLMVGLTYGELVPPYK
jgi:hypothetical protein